jgi:hypothetical protein
MIITVTGEGTRLLAEATRRAEELDRELFSELPPELVEAFVAATRLIAVRLGVGGSSAQHRR